MKALAAFVALFTLAQAPGPTFSIHKYQMKVGEEARGALALSYLGSPVKLQWTLELSTDGTPKRFSAKGDTSTQSHVDYELAVDGDTITLRDGQKTTTAPKAERFVVNAGYAPIVLQQEALKYWLIHGRPQEIPGFPLGPIRVEPRGRDSFALNGKTIMLDRYTFSGFTWGRLVAWADEDRLIASIGEDAEFDRFEAVAVGYEPLLPDLVRRSAEAAIAVMRTVTSKAVGTAAATIALTGGTLWDGTGKPAVADAVVVIQGGRITAAGPRTSVSIPRGARTIDAAGGTVLPGLWEMHAHYAAAELGPAYLAAGIVVNGDPLARMGDLRDVRAVITAGRVYDPAVLWKSVGWRAR